MKKINGVFMILIMIAVLGAAGMGILVVRRQADHDKVAAYDAYVTSARERAAKGIYYYAKNDYLGAFSIYNGDKELFWEFLQFLEDAEDASYVTYLKKYQQLYPQDTEPYHILCKMYYEEGRYRDVQTVLLEAQAAEVTSDVLAEYYDQTLYKFADLYANYNEISVFYGEQAIVEKNGKKGLYYYGGGLVIPAEYEEITYYVNGAAAVKKDGESYFIDFYGNKNGVTDRAVDSISTLSNGFCAVSVDGRYGYADNSLMVPENLPYEYASVFANGIAAVKAGGKWGLVDTLGRYIVQPQYEDILLTEFGTCVSNGVIFARTEAGYVMLDTGGERIGEMVFEEVCPFGLSGQPAAVKLHGQWTFVQNDGELFTVDADLAGAKSFDNYLAPVTLDGEKWGYMDGYGEIVIEPQFDDCKQFSSYGIAPVKKGDIWSMIQLLRYQN